MAHTRDFRTLDVTDLTVGAMLRAGIALRQGVRDATNGMFAVVLFTRERIPPASAARFKAIALDVRSALFSFGDTAIWAR